MIIGQENIGGVVDKKSKILYWIESSEDDWKVANHLFEKGDYSYSLFFGHLTIEKMLKALYVDRREKNPPYTHSLIYLAEQVSLNLSDEQLEMLETITDFHIEARYPDEKFSFRKKCTRNFTERYFVKIKELREWLLHQIKL